MSVNSAKEKIFQAGGVVYEPLGVEESASTSFSVAHEHAGVMVRALTKNLYSVPFLGVFRELVSNAVDGVRKSGTKKIFLNIPTVKKKHLDVSTADQDIKSILLQIINSCNVGDDEIALNMENQYPFNVETDLVIRDFGTGIDPEIFINLYTTLFSSSKRDDPDSLGYFGLGSKSPFALSDTFFVYNFWNGTKYHYIANLSDSGAEMTLVSKSETYEHNGLCVIIPNAQKFVHDENDQLMFFTDIEFLGNIPEVYLRKRECYASSLDSLKFKYTEILPKRNESEWESKLGGVYYHPKNIKLSQGASQNDMSSMWSEGVVPKGCEDSIPEGVETQLWQNCIKDASITLMNSAVFNLETLIVHPDVIGVTLPPSRDTINIEFSNRGELEIKNNPVQMLMSIIAEDIKPMVIELATATSLTITNKDPKHIKEFSSKHDGYDSRNHFEDLMMSSVIRDVSHDTLGFSQFSTFYRSYSEIVKHIKLQAEQTYLPMSVPSLDCHRVKPENLKVAKEAYDHWKEFIPDNDYGLKRVLDRVFDTHRLITWDEANQQYHFSTLSNSYNIEGILPKNMRIITGTISIVRRVLNNIDLLHPDLVRDVKAGIPLLIIYKMRKDFSDIENSAVYKQLTFDWLEQKLNDIYAGYEKWIEELKKDPKNTLTLATHPSGKSRTYLSEFVKKHPEYQSTFDELATAFMVIDDYENRYGQVLYKKYAYSGIHRHIHFLVNFQKFMEWIDKVEKIPTKNLWVRPKNESSTPRNPVSNISVNIAKYEPSKYTKYENENSIEFSFDKKQIVNKEEVDQALTGKITYQTASVWYEIFSEIFDYKGELPKTYDFDSSIHQRLHTNHVMVDGTKVSLYEYVKQFGEKSLIGLFSKATNLLESAFDVGLFNDALKHEFVRYVMFKVKRDIQNNAAKRKNSLLIDVQNDFHEAWYGNADKNPVKKAKTFTPVYGLESNTIKSKYPVRHITIMDAFGKHSTSGWASPFGVMPEIKRMYSGNKDIDLTNYEFVKRVAEVSMVWQRALIKDSLPFENFDEVLSFVENVSIYADSAVNAQYMLGNTENVEAKTMQNVIEYALNLYDSVAKPVVGNKRSELIAKAVKLRINNFMKKKELNNV